MRLFGLRTLLTAGAVAGLLGAGAPTVTEAAPLPVTAAKDVAASPATENVYWRGRGYGYGGYYGPGPFLAGAAVGGLVGAATFGGYGYSPAYYGYGYGYGYPYYGPRFYGPRYGYYRRGFYGPRYGYRRGFYGPRYGYGRGFYGPGYGYYRRAYWR